MRNSLSFKAMSDYGNSGQSLFTERTGGDIEIGISNKHPRIAALVISSQDVDILIEWLKARNKAHALSD